MALSLRPHVHLLVDAVPLPLPVSVEGAGHLVVVTLFRQHKRTDVEIEFRGFVGGVKATSLLCLVGIGIGFGSYLMYKLYAKFLPGGRLRLMSFVSRWKLTSQNKHKDQKRCSSSVSGRNNLKFPNDLVFPRARSVCDEKRKSKLSTSHPSSEVLLPTSGRPPCTRYPLSTADVSKWLLGTRSPFQSDNVLHARNRNNRMRWRSVESSRSRDLGFVSSNLVSATGSGFYTQSLDRELDNRCFGRRAFRRFRHNQRNNDETCFTRRVVNDDDDDEILSFLDASNNNVSTTRTNGASSVEDDDDREGSNDRLADAGVAYDSIQNPLSYAVFEGMHTCFHHSTPDYGVGTEPAPTSRKRKKETCSVGSRNSVDGIMSDGSEPEECGSGRSATSEFSLRESLFSRSFAVDAGDTLSGIDTPDSEVFADGSSPVGRETISDMERLESQLQLLNDDIGDLTEDVEVLQSKENPKAVVARRYTLGTTEALGRWCFRPRGRGRRRRRANDDGEIIMSKSCDIPSNLEREVVKAMTETVDFLWDYQSDWDLDVVRQQRRYDGSTSMFMTAQPIAEAGTPASSSSDASDASPCSETYQSSEQETSKKTSSSGGDGGSSLPDGVSDSRHPCVDDMYIDDDIVVADEFEDDGILIKEERGQPAMTDDILSIASTPAESAVPSSNSNASNPLSGSSYRHETIPKNEEKSSSSTEKKAPNKFMCSNCGNNVNVINNNVNINMNLQLPITTPGNGDAMLSFRTTVPTSPWEPKLAFSKKGFSQFPAFSNSCGFDVNNPLEGWEVKNVGERIGFFQHLEKDGWMVDRGSEVQLLREGYHEVSKLFGLTSVQTVRADNFCAMRSVLYQVLVNNLAITKTIGTNQECIRKLNVFTSPQHCYLKTWNFANRLPYVKGMTDEMLRNCVHCLYHQIEVLSEMKSLATREEYMTKLLNCNPEVDLKLLEAVKVLMVIKLIDFYEKYCLSRASVPVFVWILFSRSTTSTPQMLFHNRINPLGDSVSLQKSEMHLLGSALGVKIEVIRPARAKTDEFISHYPDEGADAFEKVFIIEEDESRFCVATM